MSNEGTGRGEPIDLSTGIPKASHRDKGADPALRKGRSSMGKNCVFVVANQAKNDKLFLITAQRGHAREWSQSIVIGSEEPTGVR